VDAASLLWRLSLVGVDVSQQASELALDVEPLLGDPVYLFNDWHAVMAFGLAGRLDLVEQVISRASRHSLGSNRVVVAKVGLALLEAFSAFAAGRFSHAADLLVESAPTARAVGGSNAQRDVINLTLLTAAARSGQSDLARALAATRVTNRPSAAAATEGLLLTSLPVGLPVTT
jgi:hypothetical protein